MESKGLRVGASTLSGVWKRECSEGQCPSAWSLWEGLPPTADQHHVRPGEVPNLYLAGQECKEGEMA